MKRFRLKRDLPWCKAGAIYTQLYGVHGYENKEDGTEIADQYVENNPEWFEEVKDRDQMKRYRLLKDLPWCKAGTIGENILRMDGVFRCEFGGRSFLREEVESNPEWFEEVKECEHEANIDILFLSNPPVTKCRKCNALMTIETGTAFKPKTKRMAPALVRLGPNNFEITNQLYYSEEECMQRTEKFFYKWPAVMNGQPMWFDVPEEE